MAGREPARNEAATHEAAARDEPGIRDSEAEGGDPKPEAARAEGGDPKPEAARAEAEAAAEPRPAEAERPPARAGELVPGFEPETSLERAVAADPELLRGLAWGEPRAGHPEGSVGHHVAELLRTIERWGEGGKRRTMLRFLALVHDSFKYRVRDDRPKRGENHHATRALRFAERYTTDERLLTALELHDRPYALWRRVARTGRLQEDELEEMIRRLPDPELFLRFVELDGSTSGKDREPIDWFRRQLRERGAIAEPR